MSKATRGAAARARQTAGGGWSGWSLALWFGLGVMSAIPLNLLAGGVGHPRSDDSATGAAGAKGRSGPPPAAFEALIQKGFDLLSAERHAEAFDEFQKAVALAPSEPEPYLGLAEVYLKLLLHASAEQAYRKAIELDSTCWPAKEALVKILCDLGRNEESLALLDDLERDAPNAPFVWGERAVNCLRLGRPGEAIPWLEKYTKTQSDQAWGFAHLGRAHADLGRNEEAERALREAISRDPRMGLAQLWLGQILIASNRKPEGEEHLKAYHQLQELAVLAHRLASQINREPDNVQVLVRLAHVRGLLGQYAGALVPLDRAIALSPGDERLTKMRQSLRERIQVEQKVGKAP